MEGIHSEYSTVYTALQFAHQNSQELGATVCFVTFEQPLYLKAREIQFGTIAVRHGGFHMLMSFMGCIGHTMAASGLKEVYLHEWRPNGRRHHRIRKEKMVNMKYNN